MKRLAVIDGKSVFYRGYYSMPGLATKDGTPTGGVFGFASLAIELIKKLEPDYVAVAWDHVFPPIDPIAFRQDPGTSAMEIFRAPRVASPVAVRPLEWDVIVERCAQDIAGTTS